MLGKTLLNQAKRGLPSPATDPDSAKSGATDTATTASLSERATEFFSRFKPPSTAASTGSKEQVSKSTNPLMALVATLEGSGILPGTPSSSADPTLSAAAELRKDNASASIETSNEPRTAVMLCPVVPGTIIFLRPKQPEVETSPAPADKSASMNQAGEVAVSEPEFERLVIDAQDGVLGVLRVHSGSLNDHFLNQYRTGLGLESYEVAHAREQAGT